ncbi:hypothetical protein STRTUCAR8_07647 [Streptomyces turgidiscabies Car8]|uniref:Uncharacterized protein n=1 Tax=Streptomyces turgidiscabies (strain Car8) TaxID=698760 RepID=L7F9V8_STRT8|nr:hypothetical protein STRTUCAR8_07647 [Streptomyces turgidiscabies Car8]
MAPSTAGLPTGTIIAPPMPCATRVATSSGRSPATAQGAEATVNTAIARTKTRRAPLRSAVRRAGCSSLVTDACPPPGGQGTRVLALRSGTFAGTRLPLRCARTALGART